MTLFQDKQNRIFCILIAVWGILCAFLCLRLSNAQVQAGKRILLEHQCQVASSLLEKGFSKGEAAQVITSTDITDEGRSLVKESGFTEHTAVYFLPLVAKNAGQFSIYLWGGYVLAAVLLGSLIFVFLHQRERLYQEAVKTTERFLNGDFSRHLPRMREGTVYRLFASVDSLANVLSSKSETEHRAREFLKDTISDISHQLKTPLSALKMYNEIIHEEPGNAQLVREFTDKSDGALKRIEQLIGAMLKITRLDAGNIVFEKHAYQVRELVLEAVAHLKTRAQMENKALILEGGEESVVCDLQWTAEAVGNLVKNALDHTEAGGHIRISWDKSAAMVRLYVSDDGSGIPEEDFYHIFKRFYRSAHSMDKQGVGLGLPLAKSIIEEQGGILSVKSEPGEGTVFTISFLTES